MWTIKKCYGCRCCLDVRERYSRIGLCWSKGGTKLCFHGTRCVRVEFPWYSCQILMLPFTEERGEAPQGTFHPRGYLGSKHGYEERRVVRISYYDKRL